jgi:hypothetical protein
MHQYNQELVGNYRASIRLNRYLYRFNDFVHVLKLKNSELGIYIMRLYHSFS